MSRTAHTPTSAEVAQHTPAPWTATDIETGSTVRGPLRVIKGDGYAVSFVPAWTDHEMEAREAEANARLIAAAPCMLDALRRIAEGGAPAEFERIARAAIAKATSR